MSDVLANAHSIPDGLPWALIGPTGVTGRMILDRALALGYRPRLIGRDPAKLAALAAPSQLDWVAVDLRDRTALQQALAGQRLVLNAAGPFATTAPLVIAAALGAGIDYLDLNGELSALEAMFEQDAAARSAGVALIGGVGFGIAASDGLAMQVSARLGGAEWMRIAVAADSGFGSPAVAESTVAVIAGGGREVRAGAIIRRKLARGRWRETGPDGIRHAFASAPLADLAAARRATGTRRIIAGVPMAHSQARLLSFIAPLLPMLLKLPPVRRAMAEAGGHGGAAKAAFRSHVWIMAGRGKATETARLDAGEGFATTVDIAMAAIAWTLAHRPAAGAHSPATAFGADFVSAIPGISIRFEQ